MTTPTATNASAAIVRLREALEQAEGHEGQSVMVKCADLRAALSMRQTPDALLQALEPIRKLLDASDNPWKVTTLPWKVVPSDGKPIIASNRHGNLFRGYIATWAEADLLAAVANAMPAVIAALDSRAGDAEQRNSHDDAQVYGIGVEVDGIAIHPHRVVIRHRHRAGDAGEGLRMWQVKGPCETIMWETSRTEGQFADPVAALRCALSLPLPATPAPAVDAQEEAEHIRQTEMEEIADGAYGDGPAMRGAARDYLVAPSDAAERS